MAPALNTIPDAPADEAALLTKPSSTKTSLKGLVAGAAVASFVLGCLAATAVTSQASRAPASFMGRSHDCQSGSTGMHWCSNLGSCHRYNEFISPENPNGWEEMCNGKKPDVCETFIDGSDNCKSGYHCKLPQAICVKDKKPTCPKGEHYDHHKHRCVQDYTPKERIDCNTRYAPWDRENKYSQKCHSDNQCWGKCGHCRHHSTGIGHEWKGYCVDE